MPTLIKIYASGKPLSGEETASFIKEGVFFSKSPAIKIDQGKQKQRWKSIEIRYAPNKKPVRIDLRDGKDLAESRDELADDLADVAPRQRTKVRRKLDGATHYLVIEVDPDSATDEAWEMIDALEAFVARERDGVIFVRGEGFFDEKLKPIAKG